MKIPNFVATSLLDVSNTITLSFFIIALICKRLTNIALEGRIIITGTTSIDEVSIFLKSLGNKWFSLRNCILGYFLDTAVILPIRSKLVHETYKSLGVIGLSLFKISDSALLEYEPKL